MSGLDPIGRKEIRDLLLQQREKGKTLLFSSHILHDVETLCDRVVILQSGRVRTRGSIEDLLAQGMEGHEVELEGVTAEQLEVLTKQVPGIQAVTRHERHSTLRTVSQEALKATLEAAFQQKLSLRSVQPARKSLETLFVQGDPPEPPVSATAEG